MDISALHKLFLQHPQVATDSRRCKEGDIFFALRGENFNGNTYATRALEAGCLYAVVDDPTCIPSSDCRFILVDDVLKTLQQLANYHRRQLGTRIIGITGTNGKTTTKELMAAVLGKRFEVLYTEGNLNNAIGVPLTLLRLTKEHEIAIIEMGASHPGDIKELVDIAEPDFGLITNVGMAHLQGFGSFQGVINTKGELYDYLRTRPAATIFINHDNEHLKAIAGGLNQICYGRPNEGTAILTGGEVIDCAPYLRFRWRPRQGEWHEVQTQLIGSYNIDNALAAATVGTYFDVSPEDIDEALASYRPTNNRSQLHDTGRNRLIIDAYNANPTSMMAALHNFRDMKVFPKMAILGDMKELGLCSADEHRRILAAISEAGLDRVWLVGEEFSVIAADTSIPTFKQTDEVIAALETERIEGYYILIKGSNSMKLSQTINHL